MAQVHQAWFMWGGLELKYGKALRELGGWFKLVDEDEDGDGW